MGDDALSFLPDRSISVGEAVYLDEDVLADGRVTPWAYFEGGDDRHVAILAISPADAGRVFLVGFEPKRSEWVPIDGWAHDIDDLAATLEAAAIDWLPGRYDEDARDELVIAGGRPFE